MRALEAERWAAEKGQMFNQKVHSSSSLFGWWALITVLSIAVGIPLGWGLTTNVAEILVDFWPLPRRSVLFLGLWLVVGIDWVLVLAGLLGGMVIGTLTGIMQWLILRWQANLDDFTWIWASIVGWGLGFAVFIAIALIEGGITGVVIVTIVVGGIVGFIQWLVLKRHTAQANWWLLASPLSLFLAYIATWTLDGVVGRVVGGVASGVITGLCLVWVLRSRLLIRSEKPL